MAQDTQLFTSVTGSAAYMRNVDRSLDPLIWVFSYEPILGLRFENYDFGLKLRVKRDRSIIPYQKEDGLGVGLYFRKFPRRFTGKIVDDFANKYAKHLVNNLFYSVSIEKTNMYLDSLYILNASGRLDNVLIAPSIGTAVKLNKFIYLEFNWRWHISFYDSRVFGTFSPLIGQFDLRLSCAF